MKDKILSIVIPIFNMEKYLDNCLQSIGKIDLDLVEVFLIDDGSKDKSRDICEKYVKLYGYKYIYQVNQGCSSARNLGIKLSSGKYIWFIDSDDSIEIDGIKTILEILKAKEIELLVFGEYFCDKDKNILEEVLPSFWSKQEFYNEDGKIFNGPCNKIYKTDIIKVNNIQFCKTSHLGEDLGFNLKYMKYIKNIEILKKALYFYFKRGEGVTTNIEKRKDIFYSFDDVFFHLGKEFQINKIYQKIFKKNAIDHTYNLIIGSSLSFSKKLQKIKEIEKELEKRKNIFGTSFIYQRYKMKIKLYRRTLKNKLRGYRIKENKSRKYK